MVLEGLRLGGSEGYMAWDDLTVKRGACTDPGTCDFEGGLCGWTDISESGDSAWLWLKAEEASNGVLTDHTTETELGEKENHIFPCTMNNCSRNLMMFSLNQFFMNQSL